MFRALSTKNHEQIVADLAARPNAALYDQFKLYLSTRKGGPLAGKEEAYLSNLVGKLPLIKHSEQAYTAFLDVLRADVFDKYVAALKAQGLTPEKNAKDFEDVAKFINSATGRGELPHFLKDSGDLLNGLFFSPRYAMSRLEVMNPATYAKMTPAARKIALTAALKFAGLTAMTLTLLKAGGAEVSLDPNDPDFLKAKIGDWRLDLGAGSIGYLRVMFRLVAGFYRNFSGEGNSESDQPMSVASRFARGKLAPVPSYLADAAIGKTFNNEPFSPIGGIGERITPMFLHDLYEAWQAEGPMGGLKILPSAFGLGVSRYDEKPAKGGGLGVKMPEMPSMPEMPKLPGL
jgi:hypothetical protein